MKKKALALLLASVMCVGTLAGCGGGGGGDDAAADVSPVEEATVDESGKVNGVMYAEGLPLVDEGTYSFSIFCDDSSESGEFAMMPILQEQTNVDVELQIYPNETATERLNPFAPGSCAVW